MRMMKRLAVVLAWKFVRWGEPCTVAKFMNIGGSGQRTGGSDYSCGHVYCWAWMRAFNFCIEAIKPKRRRP